MREQWQWRETRDRGCVTEVGSFSQAVTPTEAKVRIANIFRRVGPECYLTSLQTNVWSLHRLNGVEHLVCYFTRSPEGIIDTTCDWLSSKRLGPPNLIAYRFVFPVNCFVLFCSQARSSLTEPGIVCQ